MTDPSDSRGTLFFDFETQPLGGHGPQSHRVVAFSAYDAGGNKVAVEVAKNLTDAEEKRLLTKFQSISKDYKHILAWNGKEFDFPVWKSRAKLHNLAGPLPGQKLTDYMEVVRGAFEGQQKGVRSFKLDAIARDLLGKHKVDLSVKGEHLYTLVSGRRGELEKYVAVDSELMADMEKSKGFFSRHMFPHLGRPDLSLHPSARKVGEVEKETVSRLQKIYSKSHRLLVQTKDSSGSSAWANWIRDGSLPEGSAAWVQGPEVKGKRAFEGFYLNYEGRSYNVDLTSPEGHRKVGDLENFVKYKLGLKSEQAVKNPPIPPSVVSSPSRHRSIDPFEHLRVPEQAFKRELRTPISHIPNASAYSGPPPIEELSPTNPLAGAGEAQSAHYKAVNNPSVGVAKQKPVEKLTGPAKLIDNVSIGQSTDDLIRFKSIKRFFGKYMSFGVFGLDILASQDKTPAIYGAAGSLGGGYLARKGPWWQRMALSMAGYAAGRFLGSALTNAHTPEIDGLGEGGVAAIQRHRYSEFGSGWDPMRKLVGRSGGTYRDVLHNRLVIRALQSSKVQGEEIGALGGVGLPKISQDLAGHGGTRYVRKTFFRNVNSLLSGYRGPHSSSQQLLDSQRTARMLQGAGIAKAEFPSQLSFSPSGKRVFTPSLVTQRQYGSFLTPAAFQHLELKVRKLKARAEPFTEVAETGLEGGYWTPKWEKFSRHGDLQGLASYWQATARREIEAITAASPINSMNKSHFYDPRLEGISHGKMASKGFARGDFGSGVMPVLSQALNAILKAGGVSAKNIAKGKIAPKQMTKAALKYFEREGVPVVRSKQAAVNYIESKLGAGKGAEVFEQYFGEGAGAAYGPIQGAELVYAPKTKGFSLLDRFSGKAPPIKFAEAEAWTFVHEAAERFYTKAGAKFNPGLKHVSPALYMEDMAAAAHFSKKGSSTILQTRTKEISDTLGAISEALEKVQQAGRPNLFSSQTQVKEQLSFTLESTDILRTVFQNRTQQSEAMISSLESNIQNIVQKHSGVLRRAAEEIDAGTTKNMLYRQSHPALKGLPETGMSQKLNRWLGWSSGFDVARKFVANLSKTYGEIAGPKHFKEMLKRGRVVGNLGSGGAGTVELMETELVRSAMGLGEEFIGPMPGFKYAKKSFTGGESPGIVMEAEKRTLGVLKETVGPTPYLSGFSKETPFLYMEYLEGSKTLSHHIKSGGKLTKGQYSQLEGAVQELHEKGLAHSDIRTANIMINKEGNIFLIDPASGRHTGNIATSASQESIVNSLRQEQDVFALRKLSQWTDKELGLSEFSSKQSQLDLISNAPSLAGMSTQELASHGYPASAGRQARLLSTKMNVSAQQRRRKGEVETLRKARSRKKIQELHNFAADNSNMNAGRGHRRMDQRGMNEKLLEAGDLDAAKEKIYTRIINGEITADQGQTMVDRLMAR